MSVLEFQLMARSGNARAGLLKTRRGVVQTPTFMPVGTHANVRHVSFEEVAQSGAGITLANTYHLLLRPGPEVMRHFGGVHRFMKWPGGVLTDSGGFQIFSLATEREITEEGARFRSPYDNHPHLLSPEASIGMQKALGSDIMMVLDVCIDSTSSEQATREAMERTHRWALRSLAAHQASVEGQALFAIVQGGVFHPLRSESAAFLTQHPFDGFAIGGLAVGESREQLYATTEYTARLLPAERPRYLMGVGTPIDLLESVRRGVDMFDCIIPTKMAQQGYAYTFGGRVRITKSEYRLSDEPLDAQCDCDVCRKHCRGYLQHLANGDHALGTRLISIHNLHHYAALMRRMRAAIVEDRFEAEYQALRECVVPATANRVHAVNGDHRRGDFELVTLRNGARAVRHCGHQEVMHPGVGPWEEANRLYVEQARLEERLGELHRGPLRILDVGLGAASNAVAALTCAQRVDPRREIELVSLEMDLAPLELALGDEDGFSYLQPWKEAAEALRSNGSWQGPGIKWTLLKGDAALRLGEAGGDFELVLFDPFSPEKNPALWSLEFLKRVRSVCREDGAFLATYSSATPTRVSLLLSGFFVGAGVSSGSKTETTVASTRLEWIASPLATRWLRRWQRSSARAPHGHVLTEALEKVVMEHPQFEH